MRKFTKSLLTVALLFGVLGGVNSVFATKKYADLSAATAVGSNVGDAGGTIGGWESSLSGGYVFTWKGSSDARIIVTDIKEYFSTYEKLIIECPEFTAAWRVDVEFTYGGTKTIGGAYYSVSNKTITLSDVLTTSERKSIANIRINTASGSGSLRITNIYVEKPMSLVWGADGTAEIDLTDLTASNGFTLNDQTGELTTSTKSGELSINFPAGGVDLTSLTGFSVTYTGDNLFGGFKVGINESTKKDFYSNPTGRDDMATYMTEGNVGDPSAITLWKWWSNSTNGTMTITSIKLKANVITATPGGMRAIESLSKNYYEGGEWKTGSVSTTYGTGIGTPYGDGNSTQDEYIELSSYNELRLYVSSGDVRIFMIKEEKFSTGEEGYIITKDGVKQNGQWGGVQDTNYKLVKNGDYYYISIADIKAACGDQAKLIGVKAEYDQTVDISKIVVMEDCEYDYVLSGSGSLSATATAALADANATSIDATGLTNTSAIELTSENPNCLFIANSGKLSNTKNVIVDDVCANLELTDGKPYKAPAAFTATNAKFKKAVSAAQYATMVVPFNVASLPTEPSTVTAYDLTAVAGENITSSSTATLTADKPVLINAAAGDYEFTATGASISATGDGLVSNGLLNASYAGTTAAVSEHNYVLQNSATYGVNFYQVKETAATMLPFRAYLVTPSDAPVLFLDFGNEVTGINDVRSKMADVRGEVYNLNGQRVAQPTKGLYIVNGKKVVIK